ncbi:MAG: hypothetical protein KJO09_15380, partial [Gammaproteobacteria bacterium]|nr:hypothetical protein [Gammaproteobacteria bacterium]
DRMGKPQTPARNRWLRDPAVRIWIAIVVVVILAAISAWSFLPPPLPEVVRLGTGQAGGYYERFGEALRTEVVEHGVELETVNTAGSMENIYLLLDGKIDVALVQSGNLSDEQAARLLSIGSVFYEPLLVVERSEWDSYHIAGGRIAIGAPGSGGNALARSLLENQGIRDGEPPGTVFVEIAGKAAVDALQAAEVDSAILLTSFDEPWVRTLFADPGLRVANFALAEAFTRHDRFLKRLVIPAGLVDLRYELPPEDLQVIATTVSLVIRPDAHKALIPLFIESSRQQLSQGGLLAAPGEFPSAHGVEAPLADEALQYFQRGPSFFYRWLPISYASTATRLVIILIPLLTLMYPLFRLAGPAYRWATERRIYRWYRVLGRIERRMDAGDSAASLDPIQADLDRIDDQIRHMHVPTKYASNLFTLRMHHKLLQDRLTSLRRIAENGQ